ncbi:MAG: thiolase family protein, partial [Pseudomonadota bacterium]
MVLVAGYAQTPFNRRKDGSGFRDWVRDAFEPALAMAEIDRTDLDALVLSSESDFYSLQLNPASVIADDLGLTGAACQRVEGGGASGQLAVHAGVASIRAGQAKRVAVVGFEASASYLNAPSMIELLGYSFDAWTEGMTGVTSTAIYALSAKLFMARTGATVEDFAQISVTNHGNALKNPDAHLPMELTVEGVRASPVIAEPYCRLDCSPLSDGAAVLILAAEDAVPASRKSASRIAGIGAASDRVRLGDRDDPSFFGAKRVAAERAYDQAGIVAPERDVGLAEL